jgi:6-phosphogluconolactonase
MGLHPSGNYLYAVSQTDDTVNLFNVNRSTGALTLSSSWNTYGDLPCSIGFDPDGDFLFTGNYLSRDITSFVVNQSNGSLSLVAGSPYDAEEAPTKIVSIRVTY